MKNIQFLTDYSRYSPQVWHYTLHLAHHFNATIYATHIFQPELKEALTEFSTIDGSNANDQLENFIMSHQKEEEKKLDTFIDNLTPVELKHIPIVKTIVYGSPVEEIHRLQEQVPFDLVIMGLNTNVTMHKNRIGQTAQAVIKQTHVPILLIPPTATYQHIKRVVLPTHHLGEEIPTIEYLLDWTHALHAKLFCYHLKTMEESEATDLTVSQLLDIEIMQKAHHHDELVFSFSEGAQKEILHHIETITSVLNANILALSTHKTGFFEKLFESDPVQNLAGDLDIPLLLIKTSWLPAKKSKTTKEKHLQPM